MFRKPGRGGRGYGNYRGSTRKKPSSPRGLFADTVWHCDCEPRLPAERFQVKKEGKNKGKWFYTCQQSANNGCGFFIWADEAQRREAAALLNNSRSESKAPTNELSTNPRSIMNTSDTTPGRRPSLFGNVNKTLSEPQNVSYLDDDDDETESELEPEPSPTRRKANSRQNGLKRTAMQAGFDRDEEFDSDFSLNDAEADELVSNATASMNPETPVKAAKTTAYATPATTINRKRTLPWKMDSTAATPAAQTKMQSRIDELITPCKTPLTTGDKDINPFELEGQMITTPVKPATTATTTANSLSPELNLDTPLKTAVAAVTPDRPMSVESGSVQPPQRFFDALASPDTSNSPLVSEILTILSPYNIPADALTKVQSIVSTHELRAQGILKGRDISRLAVSSKAEEISRLQSRIQVLETQANHARAWNTANKAAELRR